MLTHVLIYQLANVRTCHLTKEPTLIYNQNIRRGMRVKMKKGKARVHNTEAVLIYDGQCPVCARTIAWIQEHQKKDAFEFLPCQSDDVRKRYPSVKQAVCMQAMQLVLPDGAIVSGEKALPEILKRLKRYSSAAELFKLPGTDTISRAFYRWFADNRYHIANVLYPAKQKKSGKTSMKRKK
jgi:predicted DCC family thiol-disulfide oxidoreductase YuxK